MSENENFNQNDFHQAQDSENVISNDHTVLITREKNDENRDVNAGVIDSEEWDRMIKEMDEKAKEAAIGDAASGTSIATRASRKAAEKASKPKKVKAESPEAAEKPKKKKKKSKAGKIILRIFIVLLCLGICACGAVGYIVYKIIKETPEINPNNIYDMLSQSSVIYDINGTTVDNIYAGSELRTNVDYEDIPKQLVDAFVSIEDKTFWEHHGFNYIRIAGAVWQKVSGQTSRIGGTSTITQQLARNIYLEDSKSARGKEGLIRKIREAYYTVVIEKALSKEKIVEAYLNTVYLGYNSNGISAAARAYFNKDIKDLSLIECAQLAALPQSPNTYAPLKRIATKSFDELDSKDTYDIVTRSDSYVTYYNDAGKNRIKTVLYFMHEQGKIDDATYEAALNDSIRSYLNPGVNVGVAANDSSYFTDYITSQVMKDLQNKLGYTYSEAYDLLYKGGLIVNSTLDMSVQTILEESYSNKDIFPKINLNALNLDKKKNILNESGDRVILYAFSNMIDEDGDFWLLKTEYKKNEDGSVTVYKGGRLNFYNTKANDKTDVRVDIKDTYEMEDGHLYSRSGSYLNIPSEYKTRDTEGNLVLSAKFFTDKETKDYVKFNDNGTMIIDTEIISLASTIIQPQSAMVIIDNATGQIRAMMGGRGIKGKLLYNRATSTRQPGSSIKPLAIYSTALQKGYENSILLAAATTEEEKAEIGPIFTAATVLDNIPTNNNEKLWPSNFDGTYGGLTPIRSAVEKSLNACAVNLFMQLNPQDCLTNLINYGISSLVLEGPSTDENASSLALGGMTNGISPLEMASAYTTFVNNGAHTEYSCYSTVTNRKGEIILKSDAHTVQVIDKPVANLMLDILQSTVTRGIAGGAKLKSQPSAGKTGTTSDAYDIWFCGLTPKYSAAVWIGCDTHIDLGTDSSKATKVWSAVMEKIGELDERQEFEPLSEEEFVTVTIDKKTGLLPVLAEEGTAPEENVTPEEDLVSEVFIIGTEPTQANEAARAYAYVCAETGYLATPYCPHIAKKYTIQRPGLVSWEGLLATYTLTKEIEGTEDPETGICQTEPDDKTQYIDLIKDCGYDYPEFYCPIHNPIVGYTEEGTTSAGVYFPEGSPIYEYEISPIQRQQYNTENLEELTAEDYEGVEGEYDLDKGHWQYDGEGYQWVWDVFDDITDLFNDQREELHNRIEDFFGGAA